MHIHAQIVSFVHLLNVISCSWCKYLLQSLFETQLITAVLILFVFFLSSRLFLSFCLFIILSFCRPLFYSFCLYVISTLWLSAFLSNCLSVLVHLSSRRSSWYHTGLISSFRGSVGMEWMWWSSLVNGQQSSKSTFGPNNVFCASLESPNLFCLIPEGICSTTTHLIRCRLGSILQSLLIPKSLQRLRSIYTRNRGR